MKKKCAAAPVALLFLAFPAKDTRARVWDRVAAEISRIPWPNGLWPCPRRLGTVSQVERTQES